MKEKDRKYYIEKYERLWNRLYEDAKISCPDDPGCEATEKFDECAGTAEVVGYYLALHKNDPIGAWTANTDGIKKNQRDLAVESTLKNLCMPCDYLL